jgi:hypothetical protein
MAPAVMHAESAIGAWAVSTRGHRPWVLRTVVRSAPGRLPSRGSPAAPAGWVEHFNILNSSPPQVESTYMRDLFRILLQRQKLKDIFKSWYV